MRKTALDPSSSPAAAFGVQLRRSREANGLTQKALGKLIGFSNTWVSCIERATRNPTYEFATKCDEHLGTGGTLELMWWGLKHSGLIEGFPEYAALEAKAAEIRLFELGVIPGLLQTRDYATAWESGNVRRGSATQDQADERVAFLLARQKLMERAPAPIIHAVLDESCLRRPIGGRAVMAAQLRHLEHLAQRPTVVLQVAPYDLGEDRPFTRQVILLTLPNRTVLAYNETEQRGYLDRDIEAVAVLARDYDRLRVEALSQAASLAMIRAVREELDHG